MKNSILLIILILAVGACNNDDNGLSNLPDCVQDIVNTDSANETLRTVKKQVFNDEDHYWLNTGDMELDGVEFVVNSECDTICSLGGFYPHPIPIPEACGNFDNWEVVWEQ